MNVTDIELPGLASNSWAAFPFRIKGMKSIPTFDGHAYTANIYKGTRKVGVMQNCGHGGPDEFHFTDRAMEDDFHAATADLFGMTWQKAYDAVGAFLITLYEMTRASKRAVVLIPADGIRDWCWGGEYATMGTTDVAAVEAWIPTQDRSWYRFDPIACEVIAL